MSALDFFSDPLARHIRITRDRIPGLKKLGLLTVRDLLYHFPVRYQDQSIITPIRDAVDTAHITTSGRVCTIQVKSSYTTKQQYVEAVLEDVNGDKLTCIWFNQLFIAKTLKQGSIITVTGTYTKKKSTPTMINPSYDERDQLPIDQGNTLFKNSTILQAEVGEAIYRETHGVSSLFLRHALKNIFEHIHRLAPVMNDPLPDNIREKLKLPSIEKALRWIHAPANNNQMSSARKRFSFEYIFMIQVAQQYIRNQIAVTGTQPLCITDQQFDQVVGSLPFQLTRGQQRVINDIRTDLKKTAPMQRLLEGDVGSGKTAIASIASAIAVSTIAAGGRSQYSPIQVAYMAPTEVLASQLFESFINFFQKTNITIILMTGKSCKKFPSKLNPTSWTTISKAQAKKWIANGEVPIVVGTHALISRGVEWKHLGLVIIDEQHRFGTGQRGKLAQKDGHTPHYLSMSATPIPRTLALTLYGDLDLSVLDEVPPGRKPVVTEISTSAKREKIYEHMRTQLQDGRQAYVICPRIDTSEDDEASATKSSTASEARRMQQVFPEYTIGVMHSKLGKEGKERVMNEFANGKITILVSTSVVEVGVNVPNASVILIEGSERFGLSQLHQLRGRVMRSTHQPYCFLFTESSAEKSTDRLKKFVTAKNGFELAEMDLLTRGTGDLLGIKQWGISDLGMEAIQNIKLVEIAQQYARAIIATDPELKTHPILCDYVNQYERAPHLE